MTTVIRNMGCLWSVLIVTALVPAGSQNDPKPTVPEVQAVGKAAAVQPGPAESLYLQLRNVGLDPARVYRVQDVSLDRGPIHISLDDGTIAFTADVAGRVTGAFFEGEGEILLPPPTQVERSSLALFTGAAILEEQFVSAYFRFNDSTFSEMRPYLKPADHAPEFVSEWNDAASTLAEADALRLLMSFSRFLPVAGPSSGDVPGRAPNSDDADRFLHIHVQGRKLGAFEVYFDSAAPEQVRVAQPKTIQGVNYYDDWTSFALPETKTLSQRKLGSRGDIIKVPHYAIRTEIKPPTEVDAEAELQLEVAQGGQRAVLFELSRFLHIKQVLADGRLVEFIQNPAVEGTKLARRGNDVVAVVFPEPLQNGRRIKLQFIYGGAVLSEAGPGLLYVGARGTWYPNRGLVPSNYDLEFRYPTGWTLLATGKRVEGASEQTASSNDPSGEQVSHWVSERPISIAGFNLGRYERATAHAGNIAVETYATATMEREFPQSRPEPVIPETANPPRRFGVPLPPVEVIPPPPSPARNAQTVAAQSARAIEFFSKRFGPYPYAQLIVTQLPGPESQGWPGLIFLSSLSFLTSEEKSELHMNAVHKALSAQVISHEIAHQWWGDLVGWEGYRDQWMMEALANYSSLMLLESENPEQFWAVLEQYRNDLLEKNKAGVPLMEDGPVTLGLRLSCSRFPNGYEAISYGRGTWLFHMLRNMLRDAEPRSSGSAAQVDEPFIRALRHARERYEGKAITTNDLLKVFEEELPPSLKFEGQKSLDWFYQDWINGTAVPRYELRGLKYVDKPDSTTINGIILQKDAPNDLVTPVPLYGVRGGKTVLLARVFADGPETPFRLTAPAGTRKVAIDPNHTLLARVQ